MKGLRDYGRGGLGAGAEAVGAVCEQEENAGAKREEQDGEPGRNAPKGGHGRTTIAAATNHDVGGDGYEHLEETGAQEPAFDPPGGGVGVVNAGEEVKDVGPDHPKQAEYAEHDDQ